MKKILLLLAIGFAFVAPPAFASTGALSSYTFDITNPVPVTITNLDDANVLMLIDPSGGSHWVGNYTLGQEIFPTGQTPVVGTWYVEFGNSTPPNEGVTYLALVVTESPAPAGVTIALPTMASNTANLFLAQASALIGDSGLLAIICLFIGVPMGFVWIKRLIDVSAHAQKEKQKHEKSASHIKKEKEVDTAFETRRFNGREYTDKVHKR